MNFLQLKFWQVLALISGAIITLVMALASISYNSTLGTEEAAFALVPVSNRLLFEGLALAFDLGMVASVFGFWHWLGSNRVAAFFCVLLFIIASLFSVHSVRGYIAINITKSLAPMERNRDVYSSLKQELQEAQIHLSALQASLIKSRGRRRMRREREVAKQVSMVRDVRTRLARSNISANVAPLAGLEWFLAVTLWFFNATMWSAWFGTKTSLVEKSNSHTKLELGAPVGAQLKYWEKCSTAKWLKIYKQVKPEHCARLYQHYRTWCASNDLTALGDRKFYARLVEAGAQKFRDGRNGPTLYRLPKSFLTENEGTKK